VIRSAIKRIITGPNIPILVRITPPMEGPTPSKSVILRRQIALCQSDGDRRFHIAAHSVSSRPGPLCANQNILFRSGHSRGRQRRKDSFVRYWSPFARFLHPALQASGHFGRRKPQHDWRSRSICRGVEVPNKRCLAWRAPSGSKMIVSRLQGQAAAFLAQSESDSLESGYTGTIYAIAVHPKSSRLKLLAAKATKMLAISIRRQAD